MNPVYQSREIQQQKEEWGRGKGDPRKELPKWYELSFEHITEPNIRLESPIPSLPCYQVHRSALGRDQQSEKSQPVHITSQEQIRAHIN